MTSAELLSTSLAWMDALWDEPVGLLRNPDLGRGVYGDQTTRHMVRETAWYALGLLMRAAGSDAARACRAVETVLRYQFDAPGTAYHGTFYRSPEEPHPPAAPAMWRDFDPNWRQFVGTTLALILWHFEDKLPPALVSRIDAAILKAVHGEVEERVVAGYSNIALMKAWLEVYAGRRYEEPELETRGKALAEQIYALFTRHGVFHEYNSPTYYGIVLYALGLWRACALLDELLELGSAMEAGLWRDVARYYHAGLKNLCGPFDRSYGMDMTRYVASLGLWVWAALGRRHAPFPEIAKPFAHAADFCIAPCVALLGARLPEDAVAQFKTFTGGHGVEQVISDAPQRVATAWLQHNLMVGAQAAAGAHMIPRQFHPATAHWRTSGGAVGWLRLVYDHGCPTAAVASPGKLVITCPKGANGVGPDLIFEVFAPLLRADAIKSERWSLPGLNIGVEAACSQFAVQRKGDRLEVRYVLRLGYPTLTLCFELADVPLDPIKEEDKLKTALPDQVPVAP